MHLYLIRHGQSHVNLPEWQPDTPAAMDAGLTALGQQQAQALADWLPQQLPAITDLVTSTMRRARETAAFLAEAYGMDPIGDDRIREIGNNRIDNTPFPSEALPQKYAEFPRAQYPFVPVTLDAADGETYAHFRIRVGAFLQEMRERPPEDVVVAVCHGGVINAAFDMIFNVGPYRSCEIWNQNTAVTHFQFVHHPEQNAWRLHRQGCTAHLESAAADTH